jgi:hypothetical protein
VSHTTKAALGTVFHHNGDYSDDVTVIPVSFPEPVPTPDGSILFSVDIPFADLRELVFAYLRDRRIEQLEQASDDELEAELLR